MAQPVVHFEICGKDGNKSREFYTGLFDWQFQLFGDADYGIVGPAAEKSIGGGVGCTPPGVEPYVTIYVQVDDLQAYLDKAESLGGKTVLPPTPIPGVGHFAFLGDPEGVCIGLFKPQ
ncbi:MAG: VOC family protein [Candidatus Zixiibacteriota bacterium]